MGRTAMPDEHEQEAAYRETAEALDGRPLLIRTLDAGADKPIPYLDQPSEANPFLGVRGIRLGLAATGAPRGAAPGDPAGRRRPSAARHVPDGDDRSASSGEALRPPASGVRGDRPRRSRWASWSRCRRPRCSPTAWPNEADFFSIGTNDLTQYTLAADRGNEHVGGAHRRPAPGGPPLDPRDRRGRPTLTVGGSACAASSPATPDATPLLLGLGVRELSMSAPAIAAREARRPRHRSRRRARARRPTRWGARAPARCASSCGAPGADEGRCYDAPSAVTTADDRAAAFLTVITYLRIALTPVVMALVLVADRVRVGRRRRRARSSRSPPSRTSSTVASPGGGSRPRPSGTSSTPRPTSCSCPGSLIALCRVGRASAWVAFIIIGRELLIMGLRGAVSATDGTVDGALGVGQAQGQRAVPRDLAGDRPPAVERRGVALDRDRDDRGGAGDGRVRRRVRRALPAACSAVAARR